MVKFRVSVFTNVPLVPVTATVACVGGGGGGGAGGVGDPPPPPQETIPSTKAIAATPNVILDLWPKFVFRPHPASTTAITPARAPGQRKNGFRCRLALAPGVTVRVN